MPVQKDLLYCIVT